MELAWNLCPFCGTPAPGMRRESMTLNEALQPLALGRTASEEQDEDNFDNMLDFESRASDLDPDLDLEPLSDD